MNLEHVEAVKARIEEIRRRYVDNPIFNPPATITPCKPGRSFDGCLAEASKPRVADCPAELVPMINRAAEKHGIDPAVLKAVINTESGFRQSATSRVGAIGLMQLMPGTARALGVDPYDAEQNIDGGAKYLKQQMDKFGSIDLALAAYNAGPGSVIRYGGVPPYSETQRYVQNVMKSAEVFSQNQL